MKAWNRNQIVKLLEESGRIAMKYKTAMNPEIKEDRTIVTAADKAIQSFLDHALTEGESGVFIIGEESQDTCDLENALAGTAFIIDPIDGTAVYASGLPQWGISIGYAVNGILRESAIYLPELEDLMVTDAGKTYLRTGNGNEFQEIAPFRKEYTETGAVYIPQDMAKHGCFNGGEMVQSIGSCVYPGVYLAKKIYQAGIFRSKLWDVAGFLPALKNLGFCSVCKQGTDLLSLKISEEIYSLDLNGKAPYKMKCHHVIAGSEEICRHVLNKTSLAEL